MNARSNPKKSSKTPKGKERKLYNKQTTPVEENVITIHASEDDRSIVTDTAEENQPIMDLKPNNTSTPKRKAIADQGPPKKKIILEDNQENNDTIEDDIEEIKEIEEIRPKESKEDKQNLNIEFQKTMEKMMVELARRMDTLERSKRKEDEEKILSNTTQDLQELHNTKKYEKSKRTNGGFKLRLRQFR